MSTGIEYYPLAQAIRWVKFIDEVFAGDARVVAWFQRLLGYCTSGSVREQIMALFYGRGWNGKTVLLRTLRHVLGDYAADTAFSTWAARDRGDSLSPEMATLEGRRLVMASETRENTRLDEGRLKGFAGGDSITARPLYQSPVTFDPTGKLVLAVNHRPRVSDDSTGLWRKVRLVPFNVSFEGRADRNLEATLREEAPGILTWLVRGAMRWLRDGLEPTPAAVQAATDAYRHDSDPLADFLAERCTIDPEATVRGKDLFAAYQTWANDQGIPEREQEGSTTFGRRMADRFHKDHDRAGTVYQGVRV